MRLALDLAVMGVVFILIAVLYVTTGGPCRVADCGPSINELCLWIGTALLCLAAVRFVFVLARTARRADREWRKQRHE